MPEEIQPKFGKIIDAQSMVQQPGQKKRKPMHKPEPIVDFQFDKLKIFFGEPFKVNDYITIHQPSIGEILEFGEKETFSTVVAFTGNTTLYRLQLWDLGVDWNKITNFDLFCMLAPAIPKEDTSLLFGDLDFTKFKVYTKEWPDGKQPSEYDENGEKRAAWELRPETVLYDEENDYLIDELLYIQIREYLREVFDQHPKDEFARGKYTKQSMIDEEKMKIKIAERKRLKGDVDDYGGSYLLPLISTLSMYPGFKYKTSELKELGIAEFMSDVKKMQIMENTSALLKGMYGGFLDTSKIDTRTELNWFR